MLQVSPHQEAQHSATTKVMQDGAHCRARTELFQSCKTLIAYHPDLPRRVRCKHALKQQHHRYLVALNGMSNACMLTLMRSALMAARPPDLMLSSMSPAESRASFVGVSSAWLGCLQTLQHKCGQAAKQQWPRHTIVGCTHHFPLWKLLLKLCKCPGAVDVCCVLRQNGADLHRQVRLKAAQASHAPQPMPVLLQQRYATYKRV